MVFSFPSLHESAITGGMREAPENGTSRAGFETPRGGGVATARDWAVRFAVYFAVWLVLTGWSALDAVIGIPAAALAAWASLVLLPPSGRRLKPFRLAGVVLRFLWQSVAAGVDVAWRVFQPKMPLHPGVIRLAPQLPGGLGRLCFCGLASLQPGSLPCGVDEDGFLLVHCLDTRDDVEGALSRTQDELSKLWEEEKS